LIFTIRATWGKDGNTVQKLIGLIVLAVAFMIGASTVGCSKKPSSSVAKTSVTNSATPEKTEKKIETVTPEKTEKKVETTTATPEKTEKKVETTTKTPEKTEKKVESTTKTTEKKKSVDD
jgi:outer membrane biosynthesis protein TonB